MLGYVANTITVIKEEIMAFLQELKTALSAVATEYNDVVARGGDSTDVKARLNALSEVWHYVKSGVWSSDEDNAHRVLTLLLKSRAEAMEELEITNFSHANTILWRANKNFEKMFGTSLISDILAGNIDDAMTRFRIESHTLLSDDAFLAEVHTRLPEGDASVPYLLSDCLNEVKFLAFYSKAYLDKRLGALDSQKLSYVMHLLNTYSSTLAPEQAALYKVISGEAKPDILTEITNPLNPLYKTEKEEDA